MIIVSACLSGIDCRYDANNNLIPEIKQMVLEGKALPLCPEELGGLSTPRIPCEIKIIEEQKLVIAQSGEDFTEQFKEGAKKVAQIASILDCKTAILKSRSPSCGFGKIYDGSFSGNLIPGNGICAEALIGKGVTIYNDEDFITLFEEGNISHL